MRPPCRPNQALRAELAEEARKHGTGGAAQAPARCRHERTADAIDPRNVRRVVRALEVWHETGAPFSRQRRKSPPEFEPVLLGIAPERAALRQREPANASMRCSAAAGRRRCASC